MLAQIGVIPDEIIPANLDETPLRAESPRKYACRMAVAKAQTLAIQYEQAIILAADTVVACGRRILPKAENEAQARFCLNLLSGRRHRVYGGVCLILPGGAMRIRLVQTVVTFKRISALEIEHYLAGEEWCGKAGGYAIQGWAEALVQRISGSYSNIVGLPLFETRQLLVSAGLAGSVL